MKDLIYDGWEEPTEVIVSRSFIEECLSRRRFEECTSIELPNAPFFIV